MDALVKKDLFEVADGIVHLRSAANGLMPKAALAATQRYMAARGGEPPDDRPATYHRAKVGLAKLMGATPGDIAFVGSTSDAIGAIYAQVAWQPGDNIVLIGNPLEFPSVVLPAERLEAGGVTLRRVQVDQWALDEGAFAAHLDQRTRLVFVSLVSYMSGLVVDVPKLAATVREQSDALFAIDLSQGLGAMPVDVTHADFAASTLFKWTLGSHGAAALYWNRERVPDARAPMVGWHSVIDDQASPAVAKPDAERFEAGNPPFLPAYTLVPGVELLLDAGLVEVRSHARALGDRLMAGLDALGLACITPREAERRAGIVSWLDDDAERTAQRLGEAGILVSGSVGRMRAGLHVYNSGADVDALLDALRPGA